MTARRLLIVLLVLLGISTLAAAFLPRPTSSPEQTTTRTSHTRQAAARQGQLVRTAVGPGGPARTVRAQVGDELRLLVRSRRPDQVALRGLGEIQSVDKFAPARFDVPLETVGSFPVRLVGARRTLARIQVIRAAVERTSSHRPSRP